MCKSAFKTSIMRGFTIEEIHKTLGETKDISSILEARREEQHLLDGLVESEDRFDPVVDGWNNRLLRENQPIFFEELYKEDVLCRKDSEASGQPSQPDAREAEEPGQPSHPDGGDHNVVNEGVGSVGGSGWKEELQAMVKGVEDTMVLGFAGVNGRLDIMDGRIDVLEIRMNDMEVVQRGQAMDGDLPGVIYCEYPGPSHLATDPVGVNLLAKVATDGEIGDTVMTDKPDGEDEPEFAEKVVSDAEKQSDDADDAEKEEGENKDADVEDDDEDAENESGGQVGGGGDTPLKARKTKQTYSDLRKPPFEKKVLRERRKQ